MRVGLIDVDGHNYPNLALMKISAWHKSIGDSVQWYSPIDGQFDKAYASKVFSFSPDYEYPIYADEIEFGGTGYCISLEDGKEVFDKSKNKELPDYIEHMMPDYSLYPLFPDAVGFLTRGCPRGCAFCHVAPKEGRCSHKVANLDEFWDGQKKIDLLDPNILACKDHEELLYQIIDSKASVNFNQGLDIRLMTEKKAELLRKIKIDCIHFAWDNPQDDLEEKFKMWAEIYGKSAKAHGANGTVYCLTNFNSTMEENLYRINTLKRMNFNPYVMIYDKEHAPRGIRLLQRWCNNKFIFWRTEWEDYDPSIG